MKIYLAIMFLNLLAITMGNLFINVFLMNIGDNFGNVLLFNAISFLLLCLAAIMLGPLAKKTSKKVGIILGNLFSIVMYGAVIILASSANDYIVPLSILSGLSQGFYWLSMNTLLLELADEEHRQKLNALNSAVNSLCQLSGPLLASLIVSNFTGIKGYSVLFSLIIVLMVVSVILCFWLRTKSPQHAPYSLMKRCHQPGFQKYKQACILCGQLFFRDGAIPSLLNVMIFQAIRSSNQLSLYLSYMTFLSLLTYYSFSHFHYSRRRIFKIGTYGCIIAMMILGMGLTNHLQIFLFVSIFGICSPICMYQMTVAIQQVSYTLDSALVYSLEYTILKEAATGVGRVSACFMLYFLYVRTSDFTYYPIFTMITIVVSVLSIQTYRKLMKGDYS